MAKTVPTWRSARLPFSVSRVINACLKQGRTRFLQRQRVEGLRANGPLQQRLFSSTDNWELLGLGPQCLGLRAQSTDGLRPFLDPSLVSGLALGHLVHCSSRWRPATAHITDVLLTWGRGSGDRGVPARTAT